MCPAGLLIRVSWCLSLVGFWVRFRGDLGNLCPWLKDRDYLWSFTQSEQRERNATCKCMETYSISWQTNTLDGFYWGVFHNFTFVRHLHTYNLCFHSNHLFRKWAEFRFLRTSDDYIRQVCIVYPQPEFELSWSALGSRYCCFQRGIYFLVGYQKGRAQIQKVYVKCSRWRVKQAYGAL